MRGRVAWLLVPVVLATTGCFATRNDVRLLQADVMRLHGEAEASRAAAEERARLDAAATRAILDALGADLRDLSDSVLVISDAWSRFRASQGITNTSIEEQLIAIQEVLGASQRQMAALRANLESRRDEAPPAGGQGAAGGGAGRSDSVEADPGPRQMYQTGYDQVQNDAFRVARNIFNEFLEKYPTHELVPDALYWIAESYARDQMDATADSIYASIVERFPRSGRAPTAMLKRADALARAGQSTPARRLYDQLIADYPRSTEATVARARRSQLPPS